MRGKLHISAEKERWQFFSEGRHICTPIFIGNDVIPLVVNIPVLLPKPHKPGLFSYRS